MKGLRHSFIALLGSLLLMGGCEYNYTGDGYPVMEENPNAEPWFNVYRPQDMMQVVEDTGHLLPVIVWANGGCFRSDFTWQPLFKRWAAEGYVVLALAESPKGGALGQTNVTDHGALIDWALNQSTYTDMLDAERVVAAGNSCGGVTALGLTAEDERVSAVFVLSGSSAIGSTSKQIMESISVPVGYVTGGDTDVAGGPAASDYEALPEDIPAMLVRHGVAGHLNVSTDVGILEQVADISVNWLDLVLYGSQEALDEFNSPDVCSACLPDTWTLTARGLEGMVQ